ncbi:MAG: hypothetical protein JNL81_02210 [Hyphomonadaceae bacterium]|nr:hypothetical protein [Hyphomonadaceae bacterium]
MADQQGKPALAAAIVKGAIAEGVLLAIGAAIFWGTGQIAWLIGAALVGSAIILLLMAQAGAFTRS